MAETIVRMGGYQGPKSVHNRAAHILGRELAERSGGAYRLDLTENVTTLGRNSIELFDMVEGDELDLCYFASSYLVHRVPSLAVFDLPFQIGEREDIYPRLDGSLGRRIAADVAAATGFRVVGFWDNGYRHFSNGVRDLVGPADCNGLTIRTMNSEIHQQTFRALGMEPRFIDVKDFPEAVRTGAVDAQENPLTNTVNFKVFETHRHVTMTGHFYGVSLVLANAARIGAWPEEARQALGEAMKVATEAQRGFARQDDIDCLKVLEEAGVRVLKPGEFQRDAFARATRPVVEAQAGALDPALLSLLRD